MGRAKGHEEVLRPEVRLPKAHSATRRLLREAKERDVSLAQHIHDLLIAREAALSGQDYNRALWVPTQRPKDQEDRPVEPQPEARGASAAAGAWLKKRRTGGG